MAFTRILSHGVTQGVVLGLVAGKFVGVTGFTWLTLKTRLGRLPAGLRMVHVDGAGLLAGIGFTMSIFIAELSFPGNASYLNIAKTGGIFGSLVSGILGETWLWLLSTVRSVKEV
jgi:NhaA family Na+:H+ antiporter